MNAVGSTETRRLRARWPGLLGVGNGLLFLGALGFFVASPPPWPAARTAALGVLLLCAVVGLMLRRRFWVTLDGELARRKHLEQEARAADRAKSRFLANLSHEVRTPLHGILGLTELLERGPLTPAQEVYARDIRSSAEALLAIVEDILDLSRIEAGRLELRPRDFRLRELVAEAVRLLSAQAAQREVEVEMQVAPELPEACHGDAVRLRQVLLNLVGNAIRHTRRGTVTIELRAVPRTGDSSGLRCEVRDTGVGIRPEVQARLFQPFARAESSGSRTTGGSGLGLVISKSIVEAMGGEIGFVSERGRGSSFWFHVPLPPAQALRRFDGGRILVVDDREVNRLVALGLLAELGCRAEAVATGEEALGRLAVGGFDAVLLDNEMPGLDGLETCRQWRAREPPGTRLPVLALTAHTGERERAACLAAGMDDVLTKPVQRHALAERLAHWLQPARGPGPAADEFLARRSDLERLAELPGQPAAGEVLAAFWRQGEADLAEMARALAAGDGPGLATVAHGLAGSAAILGLHTLAELVGALAEAARRGELAHRDSDLAALEREFRQAGARLESA
ncbi:MAG: ATP-binding protein [Thermoanaerobaculia bacterium]|nr:ATP-binding protein [Thermoanaerobaculia bacterium]